MLIVTYVSEAARKNNITTHTALSESQGFEFYVSWTVCSEAQVLCWTDISAERKQVSPI